ncbi:MAG: nucleotidyltransferase family protein [Patescibacteria group bacterium]
MQEIIDKIKPILVKADVTKAGLFGSVVSGKATKKSDIDVLVEFPDGKSLLDLIGLKQDLEDALGKEVDVVTYRSLHHLLKDRILKEERRIYGK